MQIIEFFERKFVFVKSTLHKVRHAFRGLRAAWRFIQKFKIFNTKSVTMGQVGWKYFDFCIIFTLWIFPNRKREISVLKKPLLK